MTADKQEANLPGYRKKSFLLYDNGGEIRFEHLEGLRDREDPAIEKLNADMLFFKNLLRLLLFVSFSLKP